MKATKEVRKIIKGLVKRYGKKNGCVPGWAFDIPHLGRMEARNAKKKKWNRLKDCW